MVLTVISYIAIIASVIHLWKLRPFSNGVCVVITIGLLLLGWLGLIIYWVYFMTRKKPKTRTETLIKEIENLDELYTGNELATKLYSHIVATLLCSDLDVEDRCTVLEVLNKKINIFYDNNPVQVCSMFLEAYQSAVKEIEEMAPGVTFGFIDIESDIKNQTLKPLNEYLGAILSIVGLIYSKKDSYQFNPKILKKYSLPEF